MEGRPSCKAGMLLLTPRKLHVPPGLPDAGRVLKTIERSRKPKIETGQSLISTAEPAAGLPHPVSLVPREHGE